MATGMSDEGCLHAGGLCDDDPDRCPCFCGHCVATWKEHNRLNEEGDEGESEPSDNKRLTGLLREAMLEMQIIASYKDAADIPLGLRITAKKYAALIERIRAVLRE